MGFRVSGAGWYDNAYSPSRQHEHRDGEHAGQRLARRRRAERLHEALCQGRIGRIARRVRVRELRRRRRAGQRQGRPAHRLLGRQPAARRRDPRRVVRTEPARRLEGLCDSGQRSEGAVPAPRRHYAAGAADQGPVDRRAMVLQLAGRSHSRIGQLSDDPGSAQFRRRFVHLRTQSARRGDSRRAVVPAPLARAGHQAADELRQPRRLGRVGALEPRLARRHARLLLPQCDRCLSAGDGDARRRSGAGGGLLGARRRAAAGRHALLRQSQGDDGRRPAEVRQARPLQRRVRRQHPHLRHHAGEEHRRGERRRGALVSAEHAARERPGPGAARGVRAARTRLDRDDGGADAAARLARWATPCTACSTR